MVGFAGTDTKPDNTPRPNVDRIFHGYHHLHHHHAHNPYEHAQTGLNALYIPSYNMYGQHQGYSMKLGGGSAEHGHTSYGSYHQGGNEGGHSYVFPSSHKHKKKEQAALSALTLLAFLFFINLLQNCLKEHMISMNPTVMVMTAGVSKEGYENMDRIQQESRLMMVDNDEDYIILNETLSTNNERQQTKAVPKLKNVFNTERVKGNT